MAWHVELIGERLDIEDLSSQFPGELHSVVRLDDRWHICAEQFETLVRPRDVREAAQELVSSLNMALAVADPKFRPVGVGNVVLIGADGKRGYVLIAGTAEFRLRARTKVTRETSLPLKALNLMMADEDVREAVLALTTKPSTWSNLFMCYETIKKKIGGTTKQGFERLVRGGWLTEDEATAFYRTAQYWRHGAPRDPLEVEPMTIEAAERLLRRLLNRFVEASSSGAQELSLN